MGYEIDFLSVGDGERSGDAIAFRIGNLSGPREQQFVGIVDGGFTDSGQALVNHVTNRREVGYLLNVEENAEVRVDEFPHE